MVKRTLIYFLIGLAVATLFFLLSMLSDTIGLGWIFQNYDPLSTVVLVICTGLILHKIEECRKG
ncbi:MAG: hypothetical protein IJW55_01495 [Clostridia bacterium]|nr:hypothetical protein [Clostridia bacterium]